MGTWKKKERFDHTHLNFTQGDNQKFRVGIYYYMCMLEEVTPLIGPEKNPQNHTKTRTMKKTKEDGFLFCSAHRLTFRKQKTTAII